MVTQEQLKKEIAKLRKEKQIANKKLMIMRESKRDMANIEMKRKRDIMASRNEKRKLMEELKELKNPRSAAFKRNLKRGLNNVSRSSASGLKRLWDAA